jgi:hypothetical protein
MPIDGWLQDLKIAGRSLAKQKVWTAVAVITLALGSGANTALFTIINATLLRPLPYPEWQRIVSLSEEDKGIDHGTVPVPTFTEWGTTARSFGALAAYGPTSAVVGTPQGSQVVDGARVTASYFAVFGLNPIRGRVFNAEEDRPGTPSIVILSDQLWRRSFGADSAIVGKSVVLDGAPSTVIGVMPASFTTARQRSFGRRSDSRRPEPRAARFATTPLSLASSLASPSPRRATSLPRSIGGSTSRNPQTLAAGRPSSCRCMIDVSARTVRRCFSSSARSASCSSLPAPTYRVFSSRALLDDGVSSRCASRSARRDYDSSGT